MIDSSPWNDPGRQQLGTQRPSDGSLLDTGSRVSKAVSFNWENMSFDISVRIDCLSQHKDVLN